MKIRWKKSNNPRRIGGIIMKRRSFLKVAGGVAGAYALGVQSVVRAEKSSSSEESEKVAGLPRRVRRA